MALLLDTATLDEFVARVERVESADQRKWGALSPAGLLAHLTRVIEISLGEYTGEDISNWFTRSIMKWGAFSFMPWPKGRIKAPDEFTPDPDEDVAGERAKLIDAMKRFVETSQREPDRIGVSPLFGPMTLRFWRRAHGKHFDHHLRQYGV
ncbi:MAG: DUF1569 domain-containing protein [Phycisphaera sp.]|nr:DUF1569 domain-containing protein [Phycisphaera sp.]